MNGRVCPTPQRDSGYLCSDLNVAYRELQSVYIRNLERPGQEWEGYIEEKKQ